MTRRAQRRSVVQLSQLDRHRRTCAVCTHPRCAEIEREFIAWRSRVQIAAAYGLPDLAALDNHARALALCAKRQRNVRAALEYLIERAAEVEPTAATLVSAVTAYAKINARGQWLERPRHVDLNALFERVSPEEAEAYAREGKLPEWFAEVAAGAAASHEEVDEGDEE